jgi:excisionase family DNA binding protein
MKHGFLTSTEVAKQFGVSNTAVRLWAIKRILRSIKTPGGHRRFLKTDVDELYEKVNKLKRRL